MLFVVDLFLSCILFIVIFLNRTNCYADVRRVTIFTQHRSFPLWRILFTLSVMNVKEGRKIVRSIRSQANTPVSRWSPEFRGRPVFTFESTINFAFNRTEILQGCLFSVLWKSVTNFAGSDWWVIVQWNCKKWGKFYLWVSRRVVGSMTLFSVVSKPPAVEES